MMLTMFSLPLCFQQQKKKRRGQKSRRPRKRRRKRSRKRRNQKWKRQPSQRQGSVKAWSTQHADELSCVWNRAGIRCVDFFCLSSQQKRKRRRKRKSRRKKMMTEMVATVYISFQFSFYLLLLLCHTFISKGQCCIAARFHRSLKKNPAFNKRPQYAVKTSRFPVIE